MKYLLPILPCFFMLTACEAKVTAQRIETVDGNRLQITSGTMDAGRYVTVDNVDRRWVGKFKGGREKWTARQNLLSDTFRLEIERVCGEWFYQELKAPKYNMIDKDETMGGAAPVLGIAASMVAYMAAYSATDEANIPISVHSEFRCAKDNKAK